MNLFLKLHLCGVSLFSGTAVGDESQYVEKNVPTEKWMASFVVTLL